MRRITGAPAQVVAVLTALVLAASVATAAGGVRAQADTAGRARQAGPAKGPRPADFGPHATASADVAVTGYGDTAGYHLEVGRESSGFRWREVAVLRPAGLDEASWTGYQCVSGDGRYAAVAVLPTAAANLAAARDHGAFGYAVDLSSGAVRPVATGVGLVYFSPGCGAGDQAAFTLYPGSGQRSTQVLTANLATGAVTSTVTVAGQLSSVVPTATGLAAALGSNLVAVGPQGATSVLARVGGTPFDLRPAADGGLNLLAAKPGSTVSRALHEHAGTLASLGTGPLHRMRLFPGRAGHAVLSGASKTDAAALTAAGVTGIADRRLAHGADSSSLDGHALVGADAHARRTDPVLLATRTGRLLSDPRAAASARRNTAVPAYRATTPATSTPTCSVPRLDAARQVLQPAPAQVDWAAQMAEQGKLVGSQYTRPAGFNNMGLAAYAPNSDFPPIPLDHPAGDAWNTVPRSVFEAVMAQESNWSQASWHATKGVSGDPLVADYYGAGGGIGSIDYAGADCGYGIAQVTTGMRAGDTIYSPQGQLKIAVDYQENIAAGLRILEATWNQLYEDGIVVNGGNPRYLENWFFAVWAYNSGIQPTSAYNSTGCTPGPSCTGPDGTWGLGWANNPENPAYPPNRDPYLQDSYADAAHPGNWPYEERIIGWMASPIIRYGSVAYDQPTYHGGHGWLQLPPFATFCVPAANHCDPNATNSTDPGAGHCLLADYECWWHQPVTWIANCASTCATSSYAYTTGSAEPGDPDDYPPTCNQDTAVVPAGSIVVDDEPSPPLNLQGCGAGNWSSGGTFTYTYGADAAGDPVGAIDTHQVGSGLGGHILFTHTEDGSDPSLINTGTWKPRLPSLQYYKVKVHFPELGARATNVVYTINPGGGVSPWKIRVNQAWDTETWATIGTFAMENGGSVTLTNKSTSVAGDGDDYVDYDVAFDAIAFVPMGGTPGQPIGGPPQVQDEPKGSNPAWVNCGCVARTAGDPVDTATGYFGQTWTDLSTPGRGEPLSFARSYAEAVADPAGPNGAAAVDGPFGWGWTYSYNLSTGTDAGGNVTVRQEDGSRVTFLDSGGTYTPSAPRYDATLTATTTTYVYTRRGRDIFTFDRLSGHLLSEQDLAGAKAKPAYATTLTYDPSGHLHTITDPGGRAYTLTWTGSHITQLADGAGRVVSYGYDANDNLTDVYGVGTTRSPSLQNDDHTVYTYSPAHLMTSMRDPVNYGGPATAVTAMTYDSAERVTAQTDPLGRTTTFTYGPAGGLSAGQTLVTDPAGHRTLDTYAGGLLTSETRGYGTADAGTWSYTYDPVTLGISTSTDPDGALTTYSYDDHGNRIAESDGLGVTTNHAYDSADHLVETIDGNGVATVNVYDRSGHVPSGVTGVGDLTASTVTLANNVVESATGNFGPAPTRTTNYYYDDAAHPGDRTRTVDPDGNTTSDTFDKAGDRVSSADATGDTTRYGYDTGTGWLTSQVSPTGTAAGTTVGCTPPATGCTTYAHDRHGHVTATTDALGHVTRAAYDAGGHRTSSTDANNQTGTYRYDAAGQQVGTSTADGATTSTDYNPDGSVAGTVDGLKNRTRYGYDGQGRQVSRTDPDNRTTTTTLDRAGHAVRATDPFGRTATMSYDAAGRVVGRTYSDGITPAVTYGYDKVGRRVSMTDGTGTSTWTYDTFGDPTSKTTGTGSTVSYGYDAAGNQTSIAYPGQSTPVTRTYDADNRLRSVTDWNGNRTSFTYTADGRPAVTSYPDGVTVTNGYDNAGMLTSTALANGSGAIGAVRYGRDAVGQVSSQALAGTTQTYGYNAREQLANASGGGTATAYAYDAASNPTTVGPATQAFDPAGQLRTSGGTAYTFDAEGERTGATPAGGMATTYRYDQDARLTGLTTGSGTATYSYDGDGLRAAKSVAGATSTFVWDDEPTPNLLTDGATDYLYGPDGLAIEHIGTGGSFWYAHDQVGSTLYLFGANGTVAGGYTYTPYGVATHTGAAATPLRYTGQYTDSESGLVYLRARYYDPATAEFLTVDPEVETTGTAYVYVADDPLNLTDLTGRCFIVCPPDIGQAASNAWHSVSTAANNAWHAADTFMQQNSTLLGAAEVVLGVAGVAAMFTPVGWVGTPILIGLGIAGTALSVATTVDACVDHQWASCALGTFSLAFSGAGYLMSSVANEMFATAKAVDATGWAGPLIGGAQRLFWNGMGWAANGLSAAYNYASIIAGAATLGCGP
ncbi:MAG: RHS repeat-associated core domain-containing protein [Mycobacteriales bacterium]